ncbi:apoptosis regulatory protein Siva [Haemaphysalis longicornis]
MKRRNPFADDVPMQCKLYLSEREASRSCEKRMAAVHSKTLRMLYGASSLRNGVVKLAATPAGETPTMNSSQPQQCGSCHRKCVVIVSTCAFCDRMSCDACTRSCSSCEKAFCTLCSVLRYTQQGEYAICLSCAN